MQEQVSSQGLVQTPDRAAAQPGLVKFQLKQSHPIEVIHGSMLLHFLHLIYTFVQYPPSRQIQGFEFDPSASCTRWALSQQWGVFVLCDGWEVELNALLGCKSAIYPNADKVLFDKKL